MPNSKDQASELDLLDEVNIGTLEESPVSFWLNGPNEELSRDDQPIEMPASEEDSVVGVSY